MPRRLVAITAVRWRCDLCHEQMLFVVQDACEQRAWAAAHVAPRVEAFMAEADCECPA